MDGMEGGRRSLLSKWTHPLPTLPGHKWSPLCRLIVHVGRNHSGHSTFIGPGHARFSAHLGPARPHYNCEQSPPFSGLLSAHRFFQGPRHPGQPPQIRLGSNQSARQACCIIAISSSKILMIIAPCAVRPSMQSSRVSKTQSITRNPLTFVNPSHVVDCRSVAVPIAALSPLLEARLLS